MLGHTTNLGMSVLSHCFASWHVVDEYLTCICIGGGYDLQGRSSIALLWYNTVEDGAGDPVVLDLHDNE